MNPEFGLSKVEKMLPVLNAAASLDDLIHNARVLKRCEHYDGCDICRADINLNALRIYIKQNMFTEK